MIPVEPTTLFDGARRVVFARNQPDYFPLPAAVDDTGIVMTDWELSAEDLAIVLNGGIVRLWVKTFNQPLQPFAIQAVEVSPQSPESAAPQA